jgi:DNA helicase TIP49 (TBP-interacting protein)
MSEKRGVFNHRNAKAAQDCAFATMDALKQISAKQHVLIAGPTASGKSALALRLAENRAAWSSMPMRSRCMIIGAS